MGWDQISRDVRRFAYTTSRMVITRFPFWEAFSTAMLLGEWGQKNKQYLVPDTAIYAHIGVCVLLATLMSFDERKQRTAALLSAGQMACVAAVFLFIIKGYNQFVLLKIFSRNIGVTAAYLLLSGGFADFKSGHRRYTQLGHLLLGACLAVQAYLLFAWGVERNKFVSALPYQLLNAQDIAVFVTCLLLCLCAFCFISGTNLQAGAKCALVLWLLVTMLTNVNYQFWMSHVELWTHFRILAGDACIIATFATIFALRT